MNEINLKVYQLITDKLGVKQSEIRNDAKFYDDFGVDSLDFIELIVDVEKSFNIQIGDEEYVKLDTVGSLIDYVSRNLRQAA